MIIKIDRYTNVPLKAKYNNTKDICEQQAKRRQEKLRLLRRGKVRNAWMYADIKLL